MWFFIYIFRKLRDFLVDSFSSSAPVALEITYLLFFGFSFHSLLIVVAAIIYMSSVSMLEMTLLANRKSMLELFKFVDKINPSNFTEVSQHDWLQGLEKDGIEIDKKTSMSFRMMFKSLKIFVPKDNIPTQDSLPIQVVTFPTLLGNWIFVPSKYEKMSGLQKFQLLHEIGHLNMRAISLSKYNSTIGLLVVLCAALFVLYRDGFSLIGLAIVFLLLLLESANTFLMSSNTLNCQIADEMEADNFAFKHAKPEWFKAFPPLAVAKKFCLRSGHTPATQKVWINHFVDAIETLSKGESQQDCLDRHYPKSNYRKTLTAINYLKAGVFLCAVFIYSSPTLTQALALLAISLCFAFVILLFSSTVTSFGELLLRSFKKAEDRESSISFMRKYVCWYTLNSNKHPIIKKALLDSLRTFCLKQLDNYDIENNSEESNAPQDSLFESHQEFDIYCDRGKAINYIFHGKELNCEIDYLEFNLSRRRITVYTKDSKQLDLGARIQWLVFPDLAKEQNIYVIRTKDGKAQDGVEVPMKVKTD